MRATLWLLLGIGCSKPTAAPEPPPPPPTPPAATDASVAVETRDAAMVDEKQGYGTCKVDADCELAGWQPGCGCTGTCESYAISTVELAARIHKESCPKVRTTPCPPPAPCPAPTHRPIDAFCKAGTCWSHRTILPPRRPDPGI